MDPYTVLLSFPDILSTSRHGRSGKGWGAYGRIPELDHGYEGEGEVDTPFYTNPKER